MGNNRQYDYRKDIVMKVHNKQGCYYCKYRKLFKSSLKNPCKKNLYPTEFDTNRGCLEFEERNKS